MPPASQPDGAAAARASHPRRTHYLINPRFQLKYTGMLVAVVLGVMIALGAVIWRTATKAAGHAHLAVNEAERAMRQSAELSRVTRMNDMVAHADNPEMLRTVERELAAIDEEAARNLAQVRQRRAEIDGERRRMAQLLLGAGLALLVLLSAMGVYITLKIVGPVYKLKRLLRRVGTGRLVVRERLRRGDELGDLFDTFLQMTWSLKALQTARMATLESALAKAEATGAAPEVLAELRALRAQMRLGLAGTSADASSAATGEAAATTARAAGASR